MRTQTHRRVLSVDDFVGPVHCATRSGEITRTTSNTIEPRLGRCRERGVLWHIVREDLHSNDPLFVFFLLDGLWQGAG